MSTLANNDDDNLYIVVADDDIEDHKMIKTAIKKCNVNYIVTSVYNGMQLMDLLLKRAFYKTDSYRAPDMIILDLNMQLLDGFGALKEIKRHSHLKNIPIIVLSVSRNEDEKKQAIELGASGVYSKPATFRELQPLIASICDFAHIHRQSLRGRGMQP